MSLIVATKLLQTALVLLTLVTSRPELPQTMRDNAESVAHNAIEQATTAIATHRTSANVSAETSAEPGGAAITHTLVLGSTDAKTNGDVSKLQIFLSTTGSSVPVTGYYGPATQVAVQDFQSNNNIVSSGSPNTTGFGAVGPSTLEAINTQASQVTPGIAAQIAQNPTNPTPAPSPVSSPVPTLTPAPNVIAPTSTVTPSPTATACHAPRHYQYRISGPQLLRCYYYPEDGLHTDPWPNTLFDVAVPDAGLAVARLTITASNLNTDPSRTGAFGVNAYNTSVTVGDTESQVIGEDICMNTTLGPKQTLGAGTLTAARNRVVVHANSYVGGCLDGQIRINGDAYLDVWVEDAAPQCVGKDIQVLQRSTDFVMPPGIYADMHTKDAVVTTNSNRDTLLVMSAVEATPMPTINICGKEAATASIQQMVNGVRVSGKSEFLQGVTNTEALVNSTHSVISNEAEIPLSGLPASFPVTLFGAVSTAATRVLSGNFGGITTAIIQMSGGGTLSGGVIPPPLPPAPPPATSISAGSKTYTTPGDYTFTVPPYKTITFKLWGAGGGGGGSGATYPVGSNAGYSSISGSIVAGGGRGGPGGYCCELSKGGDGGIASGGETTQNGAPGGGGTTSAGGGGSAPQGGAGGHPVGANYGNGGSGTGPGGGGAGGNGAPGYAAGGGGGAGAYVIKTYSQGQLSVGSTFNITVGQGGLGGIQNSSGGDGANGEIDIFWTGDTP